MTARVLVLMMLACAAVPGDVYSQRPQPTAPQLRTNAIFELAVQKSPVLKAGHSGLETQSASAAYTNEFLSGAVKALKVEFVARQGGYAALVLFLDEQNRIGQANVTFVVPGVTVTRTVAGRREVTNEIFTLSWEMDVNIPVSDRIRE